ncbi:hypothetical protein D187_004536 [Cystobacter fuscus DSM 2262]|uniref:Lipoprotein n=1 Tax=Cystobacter fuscus (strain ATCC 25194 / DSM 2262 / NBRC 100088 / M29) TaxID=1242864 RepID=S9P706_CYSF2|nr:hypothetical protein [Cystobacter fuscus]EPX58002.1 hypothetical protein D187_004536 [Cystobacter fuscus DSM 2262]
MISSLKRFLVGAAFTSMALPSMAMAGTTCVYVLGHTPGGTVTTPAVPIYVPASEALTEPVRVHLDETAQTILGYSLNLPGLDLGTEGTPLFSLPEINEEIPSLSLTIPAVDLTRYRCVDVTGATVPAIPYYIPASAILLPGGFVDVGAIYFNITGHELTVPGKLFTFDGKQIIFPAQSGSTPSIPVTTPDLSVTFNVNNATVLVHYLQPL